jgi:putative acetyltransferase
MPGRRDKHDETRNLPDRGAPALNSTGAHPGLRRYEPRDEEAAIALWLRTWQTAYPQIDFAARLDWWRKRWRDELVPSNEIVVAEVGGAVTGFVTVDPQTLYLDQIVVAPEHWGTGQAGALIDAARQISPSGLDLDVNIDNARAINFYEKCGFSIRGAGVNPISGKPVHRMSWRPQNTPQSGQIS